MKKIVLAFMFSAALYVVNAQTFGIHGNGIMANVKQEGDDEEIDTKYRFSWKGGFTASIPLTEKLSFMPQLNVLSKGFKTDESASIPFGDDDITVKVESNTSFTYVELPLNFVFHANSAEEGFFAGIGPSLSYGIGGKFKVDFSAGGFGNISEEIKVKFDGKKNEDGDIQDPDDLPEEVHLKAFEFGGDVLAGYRFSNGLFVQANYNHGFSNISPDENTKVKNKYFGLGIGYFFNR